MTQLKKRILVVEDNFQDFLIFREVVNQIRGFFTDLDHAETLEEAKQKLEENQYEIVFLDLFLNDSFGKDTFSSVRTKTLAPIVILSGLSDRNLTLEIVQEGAQDYLVKGEFDSLLLEKAIVYSIERRRYQQRLEESERRHRAIFQSIGIAIGEYDYTQLHSHIEGMKESNADIDKYVADLTLADVRELRGKMYVQNLNPEALEMYNCSSVEEFREIFNGMYNDGYVPYFKKVIRALWNGEEEIVSEFDFKTVGGEHLYTLKRWRFLGLENGFYRLLVSTEDITQVKKDQDKIFRQSIAMENLANATGTLLQDGLIEQRVQEALNLAGNGLNADKLAAYVFSPTKEFDLQFDLVGYWDVEDRDYLGIVRGSSQRLGIMDMVRDLAHGRPIEFYMNGQNEVLDRMMAAVEVNQVLVAPMMVEDKIMGAVVLANDDRKTIEDYTYSGMMSLAASIGAAIATTKAREALQEINGQLEQRVDERTRAMRQAMRELESFSYSVSHDLRAPLRAISGFSGVLSEEYQDALDDEGKRYLETISQGATEMSQLIDDLLNFSRIGRKKINFNVVNMQDLVQGVITELSAHVPDRNITFKVETLQPCQGDASMIRQVMVNFIWNAIKFTSKRDQAVIEVSSKPDGEMIEYTVNDNGVGFDMAYAHKLFGVFQRLHSNDDFEGTGVGLAIVQRVVHRHGGQITATGEVDKGACFKFSLPNESMILDEELLSERDDFVNQL